MCLILFYNDFQKFLRKNIRKLLNSYSNTQNVILFSFKDYMLPKIVSICVANKNCALIPCKHFLNINTIEIKPCLHFFELPSHERIIALVVA